MPLTIPKHLAALIPRGVGNKEITAIAPFHEAARDVVTAINRIVIEMGWQVERIAVDAPAAPPATGPGASEDELGRRGLSSFKTPSASAWPSIRQQGTNHLGLGGDVASLPHANKIWMLFGFELFACLKNGLSAEVIEVYPFAIIREVLPACEHKSTEKGYRDQLDAVAARTGWEPQKLKARLKATVPGSRHDQLDAFMAAWVASLPPQARRAFGDAQLPDDAIWVPL
jgi:predicted nuclease with RNAse H fold